MDPPGNRDLNLQPPIPDFHGSGRGLDGFCEKQPDFSTPLLPLSNENGKADQVRFSESCSTTPQ